MKAAVNNKLEIVGVCDIIPEKMDELLAEIETIVASGTKLDLDYYISQTVDDDVVDDIYGYFREDAGSDSLEEAMEELGPDYDEFEVRLVRIKFLCEVAN